MHRPKLVSVFIFGNFDLRTTNLSLVIVKYRPYLTLSVIVIFYFITQVNFVYVETA